jgi:hypothetical protein
VSTEAQSTSRTRFVILGFALMGGATAWLVRLVANSALVNYSCHIGATWPLWTTTVVTSLVAAGALVVSWRRYRGAGSFDDPSGSEAWLAFTGVIFNVTAIVGIVFESVPIAVIDVCRALA